LSRIRAAGVIRAVLVLGALLAFPFVFPANWIVNIGFLTVMFAGLATSWNLLGGLSGYVSLGHVAFFGIGAYAVAVTFPIGGSASPYAPLLFLPLVGLGVGIVSVPIAWVAFRTRGSTFAIVTLTFLFVVQSLAFNLHSITQGSQGLALLIPRFPAATFNRPFYLVMLGLFALALLVCWYVMGSKLGLMLFSIRDDEDRSRGVGVQTEAAKLLTFAISVGICAMIGGVWAYYEGFIYPQFAVDPLITIGMVLMVYLGGKGTLWGPLLGAAILVPAQGYLAYRLGGSELYLIAYSAVFLVVILLMPRGVIPSIQQAIARVRGKGGGGAEKAEGLVPATGGASP
jgi:branched-chain amino acid transport system permease protein